MYVCFYMAGSHWQAKSLWHHEATTINVVAGASGNIRLKDLVPFEVAAV